MASDALKTGISSFLNYFKSESEAMRKINFWSRFIFIRTIPIQHSLRWYCYPLV
jgi:hypothetical protein